MGRLWRVLLGYVAHVTSPAAHRAGNFFPAHSRRSFRMDEDSISRDSCGRGGIQRPCFGGAELLPIPGGGSVITCCHHTRCCTFLLQLWPISAILPHIELISLLSFLSYWWLVLLCYIFPWQPSFIKLLCTHSTVSSFIHFLSPSMSYLHLTPIHFFVPLIPFSYWLCTLSATMTSSISAYFDFPIAGAQCNENILAAITELDKMLEDDHGWPLVDEQFLYG